LSNAETSFSWKKLVLLTPTDIVEKMLGESRSKELRKIPLVDNIVVLVW